MFAFSIRDCTVNFSATFTLISHFSAFLISVHDYMMYDDYPSLSFSADQVAAGVLKLILDTSKAGAIMALTSEYGATFPELPSMPQ